MPSTIHPPTDNDVANDELLERLVNPDPGPSDSRAWHEWMMVATGLSGLTALLALIVAIVAISSSSKDTTVTQAAAPAAAAAATSSTPAVAPQNVTLSVKADSEHGRLGPDKQWHDAFLPADFSIRAGATVTVTVYNYDSGPHSFTSPSMNVNQVLPGGGTAGAPTKTTFTFKAPAKPGSYQWWCSVPCDPWAMSHDGYMRGVVRVTA